MISILDYGLGNVKAFSNAFRRLDVRFKIVQNKSELKDAEKIVLPGIGHFDQAMQRLNQSGMRDILDNLVLNQNIPVLGVCVGMQMMASESEEGVEKGLNWISGAVRKLDQVQLKYNTKLPHLGWNTLSLANENPIVEKLSTQSLFYFLHSYYFACQNKDHVIAHTNYGMSFPSIINHKNIYGLQFHPEKSHDCGHQILFNFATLKSD